MSMNLHLTSTAPRRSPGKGKSPAPVESFNLYQTPTAISHAVLKESDKATAYLQWAANSVFEDDPEGLAYHETDLHDWLTEHPNHKWSAA